MDKSVVLLYILLGGLSRASMSIYKQFPRFFLFYPVRGLMDSLLALNHVWYVSENRYCIDLAGDFFPQKYHIFFRCHSYS